MGTAERSGELWGRAPEGWVTVQEPLHRPLWEAMLDAARAGPGTRLLDVGCGGGGATAVMVERRARASGIDAAEGMIALARRRVPEAEFRTGDLASLPYPDAAFDVVFAANSLQFAEDHVAALRGFARVCRAGGRIVLGLFAPPERVAYHALQRAVRDASRTPRPDAGPNPYDLSAPGALEGVVEAAGLEVAERGEVDCPFRYTDFAACWRAVSSAGPMQRAIGEVGATAVEAALRRASAPFTSADGSIEVGPNTFIYLAARNAPEGPSR